MAYSETKIVIGGLAHIPVLIFIANFIKGKFGIKTKEAKVNIVREESVKIIEVKDSVVNEGKAEVEVQLLAPDRLYRKGLLRLTVMVDDPRGLKISGTEIEIRKPGAVKRLEIDADTGQILPRK